MNDKAVKGLGKRTREILAIFSANKGDQIHIDSLSERFPDMKRENLQHAVLSLARKGHQFKVLKAGQIWIYKGFRTPPAGKTEQKVLLRAKLADSKLNSTGLAPQIGETEKTHDPDSPLNTFVRSISGEPEGTFKIIGNLVHQTGNIPGYLGTVVKITSPGFSDRPYLLKEL